MKSKATRAGPTSKKVWSGFQSSLPDRVIVYSGVRIVSRSSRVLVDEALPPEELEIVRQTIADYGAPEVAGYHKLRARRAGSRRHVDVHVQFRQGTTLERAHEVSHELQAEVQKRLRDADVLIHIEPETHPGRNESA